MIIEDVNKIEREQDDTWWPQVVGDIPDSLFYAPEPGLEYTYQVVGEDGINIDYSAYVSSVELKAKSYEYNGEYYWAYLQKVQYYDWVEPEDREYEDVWVSTDRQFFNLAFQEYRYIGGVDSIEKNIDDQSTKVTFYFQPIITPFTVIENKEGETTIIDEPSEMRIDEHLSLKIDGEEVYHKTFIHFQSNDPDPDYNITYSDMRYIDAVIPVDNENQYTEFVIESTAGQVLSSYGIDEYYNYWPLNDWKRNYIANFENDSDVNVSFDDTLSSKYYIPYKYGPDGMKYEEYSFTKMYSNKYDYPTTTQELMTLEYTDGEYETELVLPREIEAKISIDNYEDENITIKTKKIDNERNKYMFYIDDEMYFDQYSGIVKDGRNNDGNNFTETGLVLPWDSSNEGIISFDFSLDTYQTNDFHVELRIGNKNPLRGSGGKFEIEEIQYEK